MGKIMPMMPRLCLGLPLLRSGRALPEPMPTVPPSAPDLPLALYRTETIRAMENAAIKELGIAGIELMQRAGLLALAVLRDRWSLAQRIAVVCGAGNNAGDGFVLAHLAYQQQLAVSVFVVTDPMDLGGDARVAFEQMQAAGVIAQPLSGQALIGFDVIVDALLGIGLGRPLQGRFAAAVQAINAGDAPVLAMDIPSGLVADTGAIAGCCVQAAATVSFIGMKPGLVTGKARNVCGRLYVADLSLPSNFLSSFAADARRDHRQEFIGALQPRARCTHKGDHGHVLIVGGNTGYAGAARLAAEAAARCGAGLISVAVRSGNESAVIAGRPELMVRGVEDTQVLESLAARADVVAIGSGLGNDPWARQMLDTVWSLPMPLVVDADGLNLLALDPASCTANEPDRVYTPHPGEAARLLQTSVAEVEQDRFSALAALIRRFGGVWVLKGAGTLVGTAGRTPRVIDGGNPGMASGGMGDALTGIIAALIGQGLSPFDAARAAVCLHAAAADRAAKDGERGMLASDLLPHLRRLVNSG